MKIRLMLLACIASVAVLTGVLVAPAAQAAPPASAPITTPITGTTTDPVTGALGTLSGVLSITGFSNQNGQLVANGTLTGTITNAVTGLTQTVTQAISVPVAGTGSCSILHLDLGPLDLNLLGLQVHLNEVVLDISAQPGSGNLLGNLLCSIAHLLDGGPAGGLAALLNNLLRNL